MPDPRLEKLAGVLVNYSTGVKPGDLVRLSGSVVGRPLLSALYRAVLKAGGNPFLQVTFDECQEVRFTDGSDEQLAFSNPLDLATIEAVDVSISLWGDENTKALTAVDPQRQAIASRARRPMMTRFFERAAGDRRP